jgi:hypothetical protein
MKRPEVQGKTSSRFERGVCGRDASNAGARSVLDYQGTRTKSNRRT